MKERGQYRERKAGNKFTDPEATEKVKVGTQPSCINGPFKNTNSVCFTFDKV